MAEDSFVAPGAAHAPRKWLAIARFNDDPAAMIDTARSRIECEAPGCTTPVVPDRSHSFVITVTYATTGDSGQGAFQCAQLQHFCCSPRCAVRATTACAEALYAELTARQSAAQQQQQQQGAAPHVL